MDISACSPPNSHPVNPDLDFSAASSLLLFLTSSFTT